MEYVEGKPLTEYCNHKGLVTDDRLELFRQVCGAVNYAHQNLVVHRDIKPGNILVTDGGEPKLLDFGIAKLLLPDVESDQTATGFGGMMTPDYASPEQAKGEPITTASDVYSLGVLLYELLTGIRPYRITGDSPLEIARVISEQQPAKPSTAIQRSEATGHRDTDSTSAEHSRANRLRRQLEGDLDNIVLKAMRKEPEGRYSSAQELSEDIRRHLEGQPVSARPATLSYRATKFARRNKAAVASAVIIVLLLAGGVVGIARQTIIAQRQKARAEKRFNQVRKLANSFMFEFHDAIETLPGATEARKLVVGESLEYLNSLADEASDDPTLQEELATAYFRLGEIQALSRAGNLGDNNGALESHRKALALRQMLVSVAPNDFRPLLSLAASYERTGTLLKRTGDVETAIEYVRKAIEISEDLLQSNAADLPARRSLASAYFGLAQLLARSNPSEALENYNNAIHEHEICLAEDPSDSSMWRNLSLLYKNAGAQIHNAHDKDAALILYRKALVIDEAALAAVPNDTETRMALSFSYGSIGSALADKGEYTPALENYRKALELRASVATADPKNVFARDSVARAYERIGGILQEMGDVDAALGNYKKMLAVHESANALQAQAADCAKIADLYSKLASEAPGGRKSRFANLRNAASWYHRSLDLRMRTSDSVSETEAGERQRITREISSCETALSGAMQARR